MKPNTFLILGIVVVLAGGAWYFSAQRQEAPAADTSMIQPTVVVTPGDPRVQNESRYVPYNKTAFDAARGRKRVFFFHAPWCPTCRPADAEFQANASSIPQNVVLFKTDYDSSTELKKQYNITYQHTFVQVDDEGNIVTRWSGGGINELIANTK